MSIISTGRNSGDNGNGELYKLSRPKDKKLMERLTRDLKKRRKREKKERKKKQANQKLINKAGHDSKKRRDKEDIAII
jgi:hypothetical protein